MTLLGAWLVRALTRNRAETAPSADDPALRGRDFAVPFEDVWDVAVDAAEGMGWTVVDADGREGRLRAEARTTVFRFVDDVEVRVTPGAGGRTRVDMRSASRVGRGDLGANRRRIRRFMRRLDRALAADR